MRSRIGGGGEFNIQQRKLYTKSHFQLDGSSEIEWKEGFDRSHAGFSSNQTQSCIP